MKKILLALSPYTLNTNTINFAAYLSQLTKSPLTAVMLDNSKPETELRISTDYEGTNIGLKKTTPALTHEQARMVAERKNTLRDYCNQHGIACQVHEDKGVALEELIIETRYADLLILDPEISFSEQPPAIPSDFTRQVLPAAECPVFIAPLSFEGVDEILFTYNGSANSMYAIRQFATLLPELNNKRVTVLQVDQADNQHETDLEKLKSFLATRYDVVHFETLTGPPDTGLLSFAIQKTRTIAVLGAYGRSQLSQLFKPSAAKILLKTVPQPIFITHK